MRIIIAEEPSRFIHQLTSLLLMDRRILHTISLESVNFNTQLATIRINSEHVLGDKIIVPTTEHVPLVDIESVLELIKDTPFDEQFIAERKYRDPLFDGRSNWKKNRHDFARDRAMHKQRQLKIPSA